MQNDDDAAVSAVRESYDRVAAEYAARISGELAHKPFDRAVLDRFAALVASLGPVWELGCGPGHVARYLHERGVEISGIDLSPEMVAQARRLNPMISFAQGDMLALECEEASLGGIVAFYSIIHLPRHLLARAFGEMRRALRPGGVLLVAFHLGDQDQHIDEWWGERVSLDAYFFSRAEIEERLTEAGFSVQESLEREPYPGVELPTRRAYILARRGNDDA